MQKISVGDRIRYRRFLDTDFTTGASSVLQGIGIVSEIHSEGPPFEVDGMGDPEDRFFSFEVGIL